MNSTIFNLESTEQKNDPVCIVFEAGATHYSLESAKKLIDIAVNAKADAIKFQIIDAKQLVPSKTTMFSYETLLDKVTEETETVTESLQEILLRRELDQNEWKELIVYAQTKNILFFATISNEREIDFLYQIGRAHV